MLALRHGEIGEDSRKVAQALLLHGCCKLIVFASRLLLHRVGEREHFLK